MSHRSVPQECPARVSHKSVPKECPTRVSLTRVPTTVSGSPTKVSLKSAPQEIPTIVTRVSPRKSVSRESPLRVSQKSVPYVLQQCPARVPHKSVPWESPTMRLTLGSFCKSDKSSPRIAGNAWTGAMEGANGVWESFEAKRLKKHTSFVGIHKGYQILVKESHPRGKERELGRHQKTSRPLGKEY